MSQVICVTGGIGSGKSTVCEYLNSRGYPVYFSDQRAKKLMEDDAHLRQAITSTFGPEAYDEHGLNKTLIAEKIFNEKDLKHELEAVVHPRVRADFKTWLKVNNQSLVFKESPLAIEINDSSCDVLWIVSTPKPIRVERIMERNPNWTKEEISSRMDNQIDDEQRTNSGGFLLDNSGTKEALLIQVDQLLLSLLE